MVETASADLNTPKRVFKDSLIYTAGSFIGKAYASLLVILVTHFLSPDDYGKLGLIRLFLSVTSLIIFSTLSGAFGIVYARSTGRERRQFAGNALVFLSAGMFFAVLLLSLWGDVILKMVFPRTALNFFPTVWLGLMSIVFSVPQFILSQIYINLEQKPRQYIGLQFTLMGLTTIFVVMFVVVMRFSVLGMMLSDLGSNLILSLVCMYLLRNRCLYSLSWKSVKPALAMSLPLVPMSLWTIVFNQADRFVLEKYVDTAQLGIYSLTWQFGFVMNTVVVGLTNGVSAPMFRLFTESGREEAAKKMWYMMQPLIVAMVLVFMGISLFSKEVILTVIPAGYHAAYPLIPLISFAFLLRGFMLFYEGSYYWAGKIKYFIPSGLVSGIVMWAMLLLLVPHYGLPAAGTAWIFQYVAALTMAYFLSQRIFGLKLHKSALALVLISGGVVFGVVVWFPARVSIVEFGLKLLLFVSIVPVAIRLDLISWRQIRAGWLHFAGYWKAWRRSSLSLVSRSHS